MQNVTQMILNRAVRHMPTASNTNKRFINIQKTENIMLISTGKNPENLTIHIQRLGPDKSLQHSITLEGESKSADTYRDLHDAVDEAPILHQI